MTNLARLVCLTAAVIALAGAPAARATDEADESMPGKVTVIKPGKLAKFVAKPASGDAFALPGAANDPTVEGGSLRIFDTATTAGDNQYPLPVQPAPYGWKGLGNPAGSKGYKYKGAGTPSDPCRVVLVKEKVVAVCKGSGVTLPTPFLGQVGIVLTVGTDSKRYCASFGGATTRHDFLVLRRKDAPPPDFCPLDLNSSTTIPSTSSTSSTVSTTSSTNSPSETTTTSTTSTTRMVCCEVQPPVFCAGLTDVRCAEHGGTAAAEGTVCDATGDCVPPPGVAGDCCEFSGSFGPECFMPFYPLYCAGTSHPAAVCQASGMCGP